jgi:putative FmdB family regulatory protein
MPIYEYVCGDCDNAFEAFVRAWGDTVSCSKCGSDRVDKQLSTFAFGGGKGGLVSSMGGGCGCGRGGCGCGHS